MRKLSRHRKSPGKAMRSLLSTHALRMATFGFFGGFVKRLRPQFRLAGALLVLLLSAGTAQATSVDLIFLPNGTRIAAGGPSTTSTASATPCSGGTPAARPGTIVNGVCDDLTVGDTLVFGVQFQVDAAGVQVWSVDLGWDASLNNVLTLDAVRPVTSFYRGFENPNPPPTVIGYTVQPTVAIQQSTPTQGGHVYQVSGGLTQDFTLTIANTSFIGSSVTFTVKSGGGRANLGLGFLRTDGASMRNSASQFITPAFGSFALDACGEGDTDTDGVNDTCDNCPADANPGQEDADGNGTGDACNSAEDADDDEWSDALDNCPADANPGQEDFDSDTVGDVCDPDMDGDGLPNESDPDRDGDFVPNDFDAFPDDPTEASDNDGDGVGDNADNCVGAANPGQEDLDGDLTGDACDDDRDGDGVPNASDAFPDDAAETTDTDSDGVGDNADNCPADANPGQEDLDDDGDGDACDVDIDNDGFTDDVDNCPAVVNAGQEDTDSNGTGDACNSAEDTDDDEWADDLDNCPADANPGQEDLDNDGEGDVCELDADGDGVLNATDNCIVAVNPGQEDADGNGTGDACNSAEDADDDEWSDALDNCPADANPGQEDTDSNGTGDACNSGEDADDDEWADALDNCPAVNNPEQSDLDIDLDGVPDTCDNCPVDANSDQQDTTGNGTGDACNDEDLDGLLDSAETGTGTFVDENNTGTDFNDPDTDSDGLPDGLEVLDYGSDPNNPDTDADTVPDGQDNCVLVANTDQADADAGEDDDTTSFPPLDHYGDLCDADLNNDGLVNTADFFGYFRPCFGAFTEASPECVSSDFDGNGTINTSDFFGYFLPQFGGEPGPGVRWSGSTTFTTCGQTGRTGPSQEQCDSAYAGTDLEGAVTVVGGIQEWAAPVAGTSVIAAWGARGGESVNYTSVPGDGARISGLHLLTAGDVISILVGQAGQTQTSDPGGGGGGGGGSFVMKGSAALGVAGGGGGAGGRDGEHGQGGASTPSGTQNSTGSGNPGTEGSGGSGGGGSWGGAGGGGLLTDGVAGGQTATGGSAFLNGGTGGAAHDEYPATGGFGGGGGVAFAGGGGGGYSGGAGGSDDYPYGGGGGGGSYNAGTNQDNESGVNAGPGQVTITWIGPAVATAKPELSDSDIAFKQSFAAESDADGDALSDGAEAIYGTDPQNPDTDGDGVSDGAEILADTNPLNASDPAPVPSLGARELGTLVALLLTLGLLSMAKLRRIHATRP